MFDLPRCPSSVAVLGREALEWLPERPDLSLLRARQLIEVFMTVGELHQGRQLPSSERPSLRERGLDLKEAGLLPADLFVRLRSIIDATNQAVHMNTVRVVPPSAFAQPARDAVLFVAQLWAAHAGAPRPATLELPPRVPRGRRSVLEAGALVDQAEDLVSWRRDTEGAEVLLARAEELCAASEVPARGRDLVAARCESLRLAIRNHQGLPPRPVDRARLGRLAADPDGEVRDAIVHLYNRQVVARTNLLDLEGAMAELEALLGERRGRQGWRPADLRDQPIRDYQLGALHGTMGLVWALTAHAEADLDYLDFAQSAFAEAHELFHDDGDRARHVTNQLHVLVERVRLGGVLDTACEQRLAELVACAPIDRLVAARTRSDWFDPAAFHVAGALKASVVTGRRVPWLGELLQSLEPVQHDTRLRHPYIQLVGWTLLASPAAPKRLRSALEHTARHPAADDLLRWLADSFLSPLSAPEPPARLEEWWSTHSPAGAPRVGPVCWLPFNYA